MKTDTSQDTAIVDWIERLCRQRMKLFRRTGIVCSPSGTLNFDDGGFKTFREAAKQAMKPKPRQRRRAA